MSEYIYKCPKCGHQVTIKHGRDELVTPVCLLCAEKLKRVIYPTPVIYKGKGFYTTDKEK